MSSMCDDVKIPTNQDFICSICFYMLLYALPCYRARKRVKHTGGSQSATRCRTSTMMAYFAPASDVELNTLPCFFLQF